MAKYFIDPNRYNKRYYRELPKDYKLFWDYITSKCNSGLWKVDMYLAKTQLGEDVDISEERAIELFGKSIAVSGDTWLIIPFLENQYGKLNTNSQRDNGIINKIEQLGLKKFINHLITGHEAKKTLQQAKAKTQKVEVKKEKGVDDKKSTPTPKDKTDEVDPASDKFYHIDSLIEHYKKDKALVSRKMISNGFNSQEEYFQRLDYFNQHLKTIPKVSTTWMDYRNHFDNWTKVAPKTPTPSKYKAGDMHNGKKIAFIRDDGAIVYEGNTEKPTHNLK